MPVARIRANKDNTSGVFWADADVDWPISSVVIKPVKLNILGNPNSHLVHIFVFDKKIDCSAAA